METELKVVRRISWRLAQRLPMPYEDCYGYGCLGLVKALKKVDLTTYPEEAQYWAYLTKRIEGAIIDGYRYEWAWFKPWEKELRMEFISDQKEDRLRLTDSRNTPWHQILAKGAIGDRSRGHEVYQRGERKLQGPGEVTNESRLLTGLMDLLRQAEMMMEDI